MPFISSAGPAIKSIQRGSTVITVPPPNQSANSTAVTINAVDLDKTFVSLSYKSGADEYVTTYLYGAFGYACAASAGAMLTSSTVITVYSSTTTGSIYFTQHPTCYWEVIEYE